MKRTALWFWQCLKCRKMVNATHSYCPRCGEWRWKDRKVAA